ASGDQLEDRGLPRAERGGSLEVLLSGALLRHLDGYGLFDEAPACAGSPDRGEQMSLRRLLQDEGRRARPECLCGVRWVVERREDHHAGGPSVARKAADAL